MRKSYKHLLNTFPLKGTTLINSIECENFSERLRIHTILVSDYKEVKNPSLIDRLQSLFSVLKFSTRLYFACDGYVHTFAKLEDDGQEAEANKLKSDLDLGNTVLLGKTSFFTIPEINKTEIADKIQTFLKRHELVSCDEIRKLRACAVKKPSLC